MASGLHRVLACLLAALVAGACAEPPNKEMDQAQGAIDAARAAGADRYAEDEFTAATTALALAHDAVADRDYRLALGYALESREHAQNAARDGAEARARVRGEVERAMAEIAGRRAQAQALLRTAESSRPRLQLDDVQEALDRIDDDVQEVGEAMRADDYLAARPRVEGLEERIEQVIADLEAMTAAQTPQRRR
jgi:hypothetical protein